MPVKINEREHEAMKSENAEMDDVLHCGKKKLWKKVKIENGRKFFNVGSVESRGTAGAECEAE